LTKFEARKLVKKKIQRTRTADAERRCRIVRCSSHVGETDRAVAAQVLLEDGFIRFQYSA
jgi:hypothetical protein